MADREQRERSRSDRYVRYASPPPVTDVNTFTSCSIGLNSANALLQETIRIQRTMKETLASSQVVSERAAEMLRKMEKDSNLARLSAAMTSVTTTTATSQRLLEELSRKTDEAKTTLEECIKKYQDEQALRQIATRSVVQERAEELRHNGPARSHGLRIQAPITKRVYDSRNADTQSSRQHDRYASQHKSGSNQRQPQSKQQPSTYNQRSSLKKRHDVFLRNARRMEQDSHRPSADVRGSLEPPPKDNDES